MEGTEVPVVLAGIPSEGWWSGHAKGAARLIPLPLLGGGGVHRFQPLLGIPSNRSKTAAISSHALFPELRKLSF